MGRKPCCDKVGLKRGPWTIEEDHKLMNFIVTNGIHCWRTVPKLAGLLRCGKSCRLRWINYLRPDLKRGGFTEAEEDQIIQLHQTLGNRWSKIASYFIGRTDNEIKNHWNTRIKKRLLKGMGVDPVSHESIEPKQKMVKNIENHPDTDAKAKDAIDNNNEDDDLLSSYEIFNGSLEVVEHWLNEESIEELDGQSSSASFQESLNASMSDISPGFLENQNGDSGVQDSATYIHERGFDEMNSFFGFGNNLDAQLLFPEHSQLRRG
ncbi:unnamed protein product [Rhodiola kirilowii]